MVLSRRWSAVLLTPVPRRESFQFMYNRSWQEVLDFYSDVVNGRSSLSELFGTEVMVCVSRYFLSDADLSYNLTAGLAFWCSCLLHGGNLFWVESNSVFVSWFLGKEFRHSVLAMLLWWAVIGFEHFPNCGFTLSNNVRQLVPMEWIGLSQISTVGVYDLSNILEWCKSTCSINSQSVKLFGF